MAEYWWSIEVLNPETPGLGFTADRWRDAHAARLIEAAISHGAKDWHWQRTTWGVVFEVAFEEWDTWAVYRQLPAVIAALDATPDPINGVLIYPGRGGSSGAILPRRPGPRAGAGAAPIPSTPDPILIAAESLARHTETLAPVA